MQQADKLVQDLLSLYGIKYEPMNVSKKDIEDALAELDKACDIMREDERKFVEKFGVKPAWPIELDALATPKKKHKRRKARNKKKWQQN